MKPKRKLDVAPSDTPAAPLGGLSDSLLQSLSSVEGRAYEAPASPEPPAAPGKAKAERLVLRRETKERGGKTVVVVAGFSGAPEAREETARALRRTLGCGGTVEGEEIVLQGDRPEAVAAALRKLGHHVRGVGA
ncbi:MAG: translation initiation factor [Verrucomicrobium sp.]|nr:translation initiation factor [Verrucomicrobium sp.]